MALAWLAAKRDDRFNSATFMVSLQDFTKVVFLGEPAIDFIEQQRRAGTIQPSAQTNNRAGPCIRIGFSMMRGRADSIDADQRSGGFPGLQQPLREPSMVATLAWFHQPTRIVICVLPRTRQLRGSCRSSVTG
jgi:hypothetical protein